MGYRVNVSSPMLFVTMKPYGFSLFLVSHCHHTVIIIQSVRLGPCVFAEVEAHERFVSPPFTSQHLHTVCVLLSQQSSK